MILEDKLGTESDAVYTMLMNVHDGLSLEASHALNARFILILMNEIGDAEKITALLEEARSIPLG